MFDPDATLLAANSIFTVAVEGASDAGAATFLRGGFRPRAYASGKSA